MEVHSVAMENEKFFVKLVMVEPYVKVVGVKQPEVKNSRVIVCFVLSICFRTNPIPEITKPKKKT